MVWSGPKGVSLMSPKGKPVRFAFIFSKPVAFPPNIHDMKCYYLSKEILARGGRVTWVQLGAKDKTHFEEGIEFVSIPIPPTNVLLTVLSLFRMVLSCVARGIKVAYVDEWLFFRHRPLRCLAGLVGLRAAGMKVVLDERDPAVDFEVATGELSTGSPRFNTTFRVTRLNERLASLLILTSKAYEQLYLSEGFPPEKVIGSFRGVDPALFNPLVKGDQVRVRLGLDGKFVIGWFGLMHSFRQIREVLIPLVREVKEAMPDSHIVVGGNGPLYGEFQALSRDDSLPLTLAGLVPYPELPSYIAACDVLLCPVDARYRFTQNSCWLKIAESLAVGRPVIATRTKIAELDYKGLKGTLWAGPNLESFMKAIEEIRGDYPSYLAQAQEQARHFDAYSVNNAIGKLVDRIEVLVGR
jgi:glycosyltransferase involved in cell wall biosynthesis